MTGVVNFICVTLNAVIAYYVCYEVFIGFLTLISIVQILTVLIARIV